MIKKTNFQFLPFLFITLFILSILSGIARTFTLEDILSAPFPSHLIASSKIDRVAWVFNEQGRRNIWIADGPHYKSRKITNYNEDNGQEISNLCFNPDGTIIVYVLGGAPNRRGEYPNPTSNPKGVERAIWAVKVDEGKPWRIGEGTNPQISPKGDFVIFNNRGNILIAPIDGSEKPRILFKARGSNRSYKWSPDGSKIAFVSRREDHSFIGIYDLEKETITWLIPDVERDNYPVWSPNGKYIAFIRFPGAKADGYSYWRTAGVPFSIWVVEVKTGKAREIWKTSKGGGFAQYYPTNPLV
jgi:Tol biopolymer transport system component